MKKTINQFFVIGVSFAAGFLVCYLIELGVRNPIASGVVQAPPIPALPTSTITTYWVGNFDSPRLSSAIGVWESDPITPMLERQNKDLIDQRPAQ